MDIEQWISQIKKAYKLVGKNLSSVKKERLLVDFSGDITEEQKKIAIEIAIEMEEIMLRFFFKLASKGTTFCSLDRVKEEFGMSLKERYDLSSGPFLNLAKTYWTYKLEVDDFTHEHGNLFMNQILRVLENNIRSAFFPTPGPLIIPVYKRKEGQRQILQEFAPDIDIDRLISENSRHFIPAGDSSKGCFGVMLLMVLISVSIFVFIFYLA